MNETDCKQHPKEGHLFGTDNLWKSELENIGVKADESNHNTAGPSAARKAQ